MAVATMHSDNIEVQDDANYENDTSEGHYESLDPQKKDDAVYEDLRTKPRKRPRGKGPPKPGRGPFRVVAGCLGTLCIILLGVVIGLVVHYHSNSNTLLSNCDALRQKNQLQSEVKYQLKTRTADKSCPRGWKQFGSSCYYYRTTVGTFQEGKDYCRNQLGADLVVINSREEQEFINGLSGPAGGYSWIGLTRTEGRWTWVDGTPLTTHYWENGSPHNDEDRNCAAYDHWTHPGGTWFNRLCSHTRASICEK